MWFFALVRFHGLKAITGVDITKTFYDQISSFHVRGITVERESVNAATDDTPETPTALLDRAP
jgi:hypothetical protein